MIKRLLLLLAIAAPVLAGGPQTERYFNNTGGLVDRYSPILIPSKNASDIQNILFDTRGQLLKRGGYLQNNVTNLTSNSVTGGGYHQSTSGTTFMAVTVGTNVYTTGNTYGGTYTNVTGTVTLTSNANNLSQMVSFKDQGVICNDLDAPIRVTNATAFRIPNVSTGAKTCESFNNYLLLGNTSENGTTFGSRVRWSDLADLTTWPANNYVDLEPDDGDSIVAIKRFQNNTYIFKKRTVYECIITGASGADAFIFRPIARGIGAWAKNSVVTLENKGIMFLGPDGVYLFDGNGFELKSDQIQVKINGLSRSRYQYAVGAVYQTKHQFWLAVSDASETKNQTILVWDYIQEAWSVYKGITANALITTEDSNGNILVFSGDTTGGVYKQDVGVVDSPGGVSTAISSFYATPELTMNTPEIDKSFKYLYVYTKVTSSATVTVQRSFDFQDTYQDSSSYPIGSSAAVWNTDTWDNALWPGISVQTYRIELNRSHAKSMRIKFSDNSNTTLGVLGWAIVYSVDDYRGD